MRNLVNLRGQFAAELTRDEMKNVIGGVIDWEEEEGAGTRCVIYCCTHSGNCSTGKTMSGVDSCSTNEECQDLAAGWTCETPGAYIAALCKG